MPEEIFAIKPSPRFRLDYTAWVLRRHPANLIDIYDHGQHRRVLIVNHRPVAVALRQDAKEVVVIAPWRGKPASLQPQIEPILRRMLGMDVDLSPHYRIVRKDRRLGPLVEKFRGTKLVGDALTLRDVEVLHLQSLAPPKPHRLTPFAKVKERAWRSPARRLACTSAPENPSSRLTCHA